MLGWAPGDDREFFTREELIAAFTIEGMLEKDSVFDEQKLDWLNGEHIRAKPLADLVQKAVPIWVGAGWITAEEAELRRDELTKIVVLSQERLRTTQDLLAFGYFFNDPDGYEERHERNTGGAKRQLGSRC